MQKDLAALRASVCGSHESALSPPSPRIARLDRWKFTIRLDASSCGHGCAHPSEWSSSLKVRDMSAVTTRRSTIILIVDTPGYSWAGPDTGNHIIPDSTHQ